MFWIAFFTCLFMVYALSSWLTKLMANAGYSLGSALTFVLVLNFGAIAGAVGGGWLADRFHIKHVLVVFFALAAVSIAMLGYKVPTAVLYFLVGMAGATTALRGERSPGVDGLRPAPPLGNDCLE